MTTAAQLIAAIEASGFEARDYSGRGMFGQYCVGVSLDSPGEIASLRLPRGTPEPHTDSLGKGIIAYWPSIAWPNEEETA